MTELRGILLTGLPEAVELSSTADRLPITKLKRCLIATKGLSIKVVSSAVEASLAPTADR